MKNSLSPLIFILDDLIRRAEVEQARRTLRGLARKKIPRAQLKDIASLARRANLPELALKLLHPIVRAERSLPQPASNEEIAEYADSLARMGAFEEALQLLARLPDGRSPVVLLYRASALMHQWRYAEAIPCLESYIVSAKIDAYQKLVGRVNLAASYIFERRHEETSVLLQTVLAETKEQRLHRLYGNALELSAQNAILQARWAEAESFLQLAESALLRSGGLDLFFVRKWRAMLSLLKNGPTAQSRAELARVRANAEEKGHWETVRTCDRYLAVARKDRRLLTHLYFGTPFESFRARLSIEAGESFRVPDEYVWPLKRDKEPGECFDLLSASASGPAGRLKAGQSSHRLLASLCRDFYRPARIAPLHEGIYPGEYFNPQSSPHRVHQAVNRLRQWFQSNDLPLAIEEVEGGYRLAAKSPFSIRIRQAARGGDKHEWLLGRLRLSSSKSGFSAREAATLLQMHPRAVQRLLEKAIENGVLSRAGAGPRTRYVFV